MDIGVLKFLLNNPDELEESAEDAGVCSGDTKGIIRQLIGTDGDIDELSANQLYHYNEVIRPFLDDVPCEGVLGYDEDQFGNPIDSCTGNGYVDEDFLLLSYEEGQMLCQHCRYDKEQWDSE